MKKNHIFCNSSNNDGLMCDTKLTSIPLQLGHKRVLPVSGFPDRFGLIMLKRYQIEYLTPFNFRPPSINKIFFKTVVRGVLEEFRPL